MFLGTCLKNIKHKDTIKFSFNDLERIFHTDLIIFLIILGFFPSHTKLLIFLFFTNQNYYFISKINVLSNLEYETQFRKYS